MTSFRVIVPLRKSRCKVQPRLPDRRVDNRKTQVELRRPPRWVKPLALATD